MIPKKICFGLALLYKGKPNAQLYSYQYNNQFIMGYEGIKTGGRITSLEVSAKTKERAESSLIKTLKKWNIV